jgi:uncharacterized metal-binding protein
MNDIKVYVNFRTFVIMTTVWIALLLIQAIMSILFNFHVTTVEYDLPTALMNIFMLLSGSLLTIFTGIEKGVTFTGTTESTSITEKRSTTDSTKGVTDEKIPDTSDPAS